MKRGRYAGKERHAEEDVGAALVELAGQPALRDVELEECMVLCLQCFFTHGDSRALAVRARPAVLKFNKF